MSQSLDIGAALGGRKQHGAARLAVQHDAEVQLATNVLALGDQHLRDHLALGARLLGHEPLAEHQARQSLDLLGASIATTSTYQPSERARESVCSLLCVPMAQVNAALEAGIERAQTTTTCEDLRLHNQVLATCTNRSVSRSLSLARSLVKASSAYRAPRRPCAPPRPSRPLPGAGR